MKVYSLKLKLHSLKVELYSIVKNPAVFIKVKRFR